MKDKYRVVVIGGGVVGASSRTLSSGSSPSGLRPNSAKCSTISSGVSSASFAINHPRTSLVVWWVRRPEYHPGRHRLLVARLAWVQFSL